MLEKETVFNFDAACVHAFEDLKRRLVSAPILVVPDWSLPFELMCDASDYALGVVLGQHKNKTLRHSMGDLVDHHLVG